MADPLLEVTPDPLRDWPLKLRLNAAAVRLASAIYYARAEVYGVGRSPLWDALTMTIKREWIERAEDILRDLKPRAVTEPVARIAFRPSAVASQSLTIRAVGVFPTRDHPHGSICLITFSDGRQLVSETPGLAAKAHTLWRHHCRVRVSERSDRSHVLDRLESLS